MLRPTNAPKRKVERPRIQTLRTEGLTGKREAAPALTKGGLQTGAFEDIAALKASELAGDGLSRFRARGTTA